MVCGLEGEFDDVLIKLGWDIIEGQCLVLGYEIYIDEGDYSYCLDMGLLIDLVIVVGLNILFEFFMEYICDILILNYDVEVGESIFFEIMVFQNISEFWCDESGLFQLIVGFIVVFVVII